MVDVSSDNDDFIWIVPDIRTTISNLRVGTILISFDVS